MGPEEVWAAEPVVRRVVAARVRDRSVVDDLVQDVLERLLRARARIDGATLEPYAAVTARNVVADHARRAGHEDLVDVVDLTSPDEGPEVAALASERRAHLATALDRIPPRERGWLIAHEGAGVPVGDLDSAGASAATMRVRLVRARARLRVEYVLAASGTQLPTAQCRGALLAVAAGERARAATADRHLDGCDACAGLRHEVVARRPGLAVVVPVLAWRWVTRPVRAHPVASATAGAAAVALAAASVAVALTAPGTPAHRTPAHRTPVAAPAPSGSAQIPGPGPAPTPSTTAPQAGTGGLTVDGQPLGTAALRPLAGHTVTARGVTVISAVTHDGFWVGTSPADEVFVEMVGPLRSLQVVAGEKVWFVATVVAQSGDWASYAGVAPSQGAGRLDSQGAHLAAVTTSVTALR